MTIGKIKIKNNKKDVPVMLQFTMFSENGYKPISCLIDVSVSEYNTNPKEYRNKAIQKICAKRCMNAYDVKKYGYTKIKVRKYEKRLDK